MGPKRKISETVGSSLRTAKLGRKQNGIKGITVAEKSNDALRDELLEALVKGGIVGEVQSKIVFAHTGIYIREQLFGWVGPSGFCIRCNNVAQKKVCKSHGCPVMVSSGHKGDNYFVVTEDIFKDPSKLCALAEDVLAAAPVKKAKSAKKAV